MTRTPKRDQTCTTCDGTGRVESDTSHDGTVACPACDGQGRSTSAEVET